MMDTHSECLLTHVHPDLVKVIEAAAQTPQPFIVVYSIRTLAAERQAVASGHSQTMHSRHLPQPKYTTPTDPAGLSCAVDLAALDANGHINWASGHEREVYGAIWRQVQDAAAKLNIPVEWGGNWTSIADFGHIQLPWAQYP